MSFYQRKIKYYKSFRLIDTDGDNLKDTMVYKPYADNYNIQIGLNQEIKNIGYYNIGTNDDFEVVDFSTIWDENNTGSDFQDGYTPPPLEDPTGDEGETAPLSPTEFCNDENATNYEGQLLGVAGFTPCPNNQCCQYLDLGNYSFGAGTGSGTSPTINGNVIDCLAFYTDWGPWNDEILLNDTNQTYVVSDECVLTFRLWNTKFQQPTGFGFVDNIDKGGWYGASITIEVDGVPLTNSSTLIENIDDEIDFSVPYNGFTLNEKVRIWTAKENIFSPISNNYYSTKPFRDFTIKPLPGTTIKITYNNPSIGGAFATDYNFNAKYLRLQVFRGTVNEPKPIEPDDQQVYNVNDLIWESGTLLNTFLGPPGSLISNGEKFVFLGNTTPTNLARNHWQSYSYGYSDPTPTVPWQDTNTLIPVGYFYSVPVQNLYEFGDAILPFEDSIVSDTSYFSNPSEELQNFNFECIVDPNNVCYFDRDGDGFIETDANYPTIDPTESGSVDPGLFSKTRYDSPYIYIKPGTKDNDSPLTLNSLSVTPNPAGTTVSQPSEAGWRRYGFGIGGTSAYDNVSPTCQLNGCDNIDNSVTELTDVSNVNIFLPQPDNGISVSLAQCANFGTGTTVNHNWNTGSWDSYGGCCSKQWDAVFQISGTGPYLKNECSRCHGQMTTRSAQPVFDTNTKIKMQTTGSGIYYGPFYDPTNPTYNGYGLAFAKATKFCRDIKNKNGVKIINSPAGTDVNELFIGGILHGGAKFTTINPPNTDFTNSYGLVYNSSSLNNEYDNCSTTGNAFNNQKAPLRCTRVTNDPNCPSGNCMRCIYCFSCSTEPKAPSVFTGDNSSDPSGPSGGVTPIGG